MKDCTNGKLQEALEYANSIGNATLQNCLDNLDRFDVNNNAETEIYTDFAPKSFYFVRKKDGIFWGNGGIIFHGNHDNGGDGGYPTFSVSLDGNTEARWQIHT